MIVYVEERASILSSKKEQKKQRSKVVVIRLNNSNKILLHSGKFGLRIMDNVNEMIKDLHVYRENLYTKSMDEIIEFLDTLAVSWKNDKELEGMLGGSIKQLADFFEKDNVINMINFSLRGDFLILDKFVDIGPNNNLYACHPRGLVVHWLAGNVAILGLYSILQALITKNVSLVKASSRAYKELLVLIESMAKIKTDKIDGKEIVKTISVVLIDNEDTETQQIISNAADVRVAWGGKEAIESILSLKKNISCEDIIFGPKYSFGIIDKNSLKNSQKIASRLAFDISTFDQYACSSPHTIFVENEGPITPIEFAEELGKNLDLVGKKFLPKQESNAAKNMEILSLRAKYSMVGNVFASKNCDWTVIYTEEEGLANPCFSRVIFVKPIKDIKEIFKYGSSKIQTIGCSIESGAREEIIKQITKEGGYRCPKFGEMTLYESPWDGLFPLDRMVRWVKLDKT